MGIPSVVDRVIQQAIYQVMMPIFDPDFSEVSYGFRPGRSAKDAALKVREHIRERYRVAVDMDLAKFFDRVDHDVLMHRVALKIGDKRVLRLIGKYLRAGVMVKRRLQKSREGVPQGGLCKALHNPPWGVPFSGYIISSPSTTPAFNHLPTSLKMPPSLTLLRSTPRNNE